MRYGKGNIGESIKEEPVEKPLRGIEMSSKGSAGVS